MVIEMFNFYINIILLQFNIIFFSTNKIDFRFIKKSIIVNMVEIIEHVNSTMKRRNLYRCKSFPV